MNATQPKAIHQDRWNVQVEMTHGDDAAREVAERLLGRSVVMTALAGPRPGRPGVATFTANPDVIAQKAADGALTDEDAARLRTQHTDRCRSLNHADLLCAGECLSDVTTADLEPGTVVVFPETGPKGLLLPIDAEHPGTVHEVASVEPFILAAGPRAGQQATEKGEPLFTVTMRDGRLIGVTAAWVWTLAPKVTTVHLADEVDGLALCATDEAAPSLTDDVDAVTCETCRDAL